MRALSTNPLMALFQAVALTTGLAAQEVQVSVEPTGHGFNYWPYGYSCNVLFQANWSQPTVQQKVAADIDLMTSLNTKAVRLMFWPGIDEYGDPISGFYSPGQNMGGTFDTVYWELVANLPSLVAMFAQRGIKVIIAFGNTYQVDGSVMYYPWWRYGWGNNFPLFLAQSSQWINGITGALHGSGAGVNVLYYDLHQEASPNPPRVSEDLYIQHVYDNSVVPVAKRGFSVLNATADIPALATVLGPTRSNAFGDFHCYPEHAPPANPDLETHLQELRIHFPGRPVYIGEYGRKDIGLNPVICGPLEQDCYEVRQRDFTLSMLDRATNANAKYLLNWLLWNWQPGHPGVETSGWGVEHDPRHVLGTMAQRLGAMPNSDAEQINGPTLEPQGWGGGSSGPSSFTFLGMNNRIAGWPDAATNEWYARLATTGATSAQSVWIATPMFNVVGSQTLYTNAFIRSDMTNVQLVVHEFFGSSSLPSLSTAGPAFQPVGWSFNNYLHRVGGWRLKLDSQTTRVLVAISASIPAGAVGPRTLDVDTMSATAR